MPRSKVLERGKGFTLLKWLFDFEGDADIGGDQQLAGCHRHLRVERGGEVVCHPFRTLELASQIATDPWWNAERLRTGTENRFQLRKAGKPA